MSATVSVSGPDAPSASRFRCWIAICSARYASRREMMCGGGATGRPSPMPPLMPPPANLALSAESGRMGSSLTPSCQSANTSVTSRSCGIGYRSLRVATAANRRRVHVGGELLPFHLPAADARSRERWRGCEERRRRGAEVQGDWAESCLHVRADRLRVLIYGGSRRARAPPLEAVAWLTFCGCLSRCVPTHASRRACGGA